MGQRCGLAAWGLGWLGLISGREVGLIGEMGLLVEWVGRSMRWVDAGDGLELGWRLGCEIGLAVEEEERR